MSAEFSSKLLLLRQSKNISQKQAAADLGISQALLSHYEKGIRECSLSFVVKAAEYYGVSTDYLLGASSVRTKSEELIEPSSLRSDQEIIPLTVLRSIVRLAYDAQESDEEHELFFSDFFSVCIKKYISLLSEDGKKDSRLCDIIILSALSENASSMSEENIEITRTTSLNTVNRHADTLIKKYISEIL